MSLDIRSPSQRHPELVIAQQCSTCQKLFRPDSTGGVFVGWFGECMDCSDAGDDATFDLDTTFDAGREAAIRAGDTGNTGLPCKMEGLQPSYTHDEYVARVDAIWRQGRPWHTDLDRVEIR